MASKRTLTFLAVAILVTAATSPAAELGGRQPGLEIYVAPDRTFALYKPVGWEVRADRHPNGRTIIVVAPTGHAFAQMTFLHIDDRGNDSVRLATNTVRNVRAQIPGLRIAWVRTTPDRRRTAMEIEYEAPDRTPLRGRQYFFMNHPEARVFGYEAEKARFSELQPVLLSVLSNITLLDPTQWKEPVGGSRPAPPLDLPLRPQSLSDGSASLMAPPDWQVVGAKGRVLARNPTGDTAFAFSTGDFWGPSTLPYFDSSRIPGVIHTPYRPPIDALIMLMQRFGSSRVQVIERSRDPARAAAASSALNRRTEVESAVLTFTSEHGVRCKGYYDVLGFNPMPSGQWGILFFAVWAPEAQFDRYLPSLMKIGGSFHIDERWAADYIRAGMENLKRLSARTSRMMAETATAARESLTAAFQERARSQEYLDYKRTATIRGEQEWVSEVEGGTLYKSDHWGLSREGRPLLEGQPYNYYNYQGQNPRYNETMTPVDASREVFEKVYAPPR